MTNATFRHLRAAYASACADVQRWQPGGVPYFAALNIANRLWQMVADEVNLRSIRMNARAWRRMQAAK